MGSVSFDRYEPRRVLTESELARRWQVSKKTLQGWRAKGIGPTFLKLGRCVRYPLRNIEAAESRSVPARAPPI
jgi:hypothetical protein